MDLLLKIDVKMINNSDWLGYMRVLVSWVTHFGSCHDLTVRESSPALLGSVLTARSLELASGSVSPFLSVPPLLRLCLCLCLSLSLSVFQK